MNLNQRWTLFLLVCSIACFALYGCTTAAATETIATTAATAGAIIVAIKPLLSPEAAAKLELIAHNVDGTVQATATAVSSLVDAITQVKASASQQLAAAHEALQAQANTIAAQGQQLAALPTKTDVALLSAGVTTGGGVVLNGVRNVTRAKAITKATA